MEIFEISKGLFQSNKVDDTQPIFQNGIDVVIDLEGGFDFHLYPAFIHSYLYWHIIDWPFLPDVQYLWAIAGLGWHLWQGGQKVLVHCSRGKNRSSLCVGCILHLSGKTGAEAVEMIRAKVPDALSNGVFYNYLMSLGGDAQ